MWICSVADYSISATLSVMSDPLESLAHLLAILAFNEYPNIAVGGVRVKYPSLALALERFKR